MTIEEIELMRQGIVKKYQIGGVILLIAVVITFLYQPIFSIWVLFLGIIIIMISTAKASKEFKMAFKHYFVAGSLNKSFTNVNYQPEGGITSQEIAATEMMQLGNRFSSNDYIEGMHNGIKFRQADVCIQHVTRDSDGNSSTTTYFRGRWIVVKFNKKFKANLQVKSKDFYYAKTNSLFSSSKYHKVPLESQAFNDMYITYAVNPHDVFYVLTPTIMENLMDMEMKLHGKFLFCFVGDELHIGFNNSKDSFEPNVFKAINAAEIESELQKELNVIVYFIDQLDLDKDIFRGEV